MQLCLVAKHSDSIEGDDIMNSRLLEVIAKMGELRITTIDELVAINSAVMFAGDVLKDENMRGEFTRIYGWKALVSLEKLVQEK